MLETTKLGISGFRKKSKMAIWKNGFTAPEYVRNHLQNHFFLELQMSEIAMPSEEVTNPGSLHTHGQLQIRDLGKIFGNPVLWPRVCTMLLTYRISWGYPYPLFIQSDMAGDHKSDMSESRSSCDHGRYDYRMSGTSRWLIHIRFEPTSLSPCSWDWSHEHIMLMGPVP